jgi:hypothetical protein
MREWRTAEAMFADLQDVMNRLERQGYSVEGFMPAPKDKGCDYLVVASKEAKRK